MKKNRYAGIKVQIFDTDDNLIGTTKILEHDSQLSEVTLDDKLGLALEYFYRAKILTTPPKWFNCKSVSKTRSILSFFGEQEIEGRKHKRYKVETMIVIEGFIRSKHFTKLEPSIPVIVQDVSSSGLRFVVHEDMFKIGDVITGHLHMGSTTKMVNLEIRNTSPNFNSMYEYGCWYKPQ